MLPSSIRLPLRFDPVRLRADLGRILGEEYVPHFNKAYYRGDWSVVPLRSIGGRADQIYPDPTKTDQFADTPLLDRCGYVRGILGQFQCPLQAVRFLRLAAGSVIREHRDHRLGFEDGEVRLHIPVITNPEVEFVLAGRRIEMEAGDCWYHDFNQLHSVVNPGATDRVHLVIDAVLSGWLSELIRGAASAMATDAAPQPQPRPSEMVIDR